MTGTWDGRQCNRVASSDCSLLVERGVGIARPYSTVTDLARLRGWSTSVPMKTAVW